MEYGRSHLIPNIRFVTHRHEFMVIEFVPLSFLVIHPDWTDPDFQTMRFALEPGVYELFLVPSTVHAISAKRPTMDANTVFPIFTRMLDGALCVA